jgi:hypothetical protein
MKRNCCEVSAEWADACWAQCAANQMIGAKYNENEHVKRFTAVGLRTCFRNFQFTQESPGGYKDKADIAAFC